jgi:hypothetical protein
MLPARAEKQVDEVYFETYKFEKDGRVVKEISVKEANQTYQFREQVYLYGESKLREMCSLAGFEVLHCFGNYQLADKDAQSDRCIVYCRKPGS